MPILGMMLLGKMNYTLLPCNSVESILPKSYVEVNWYIGQLECSRIAIFEFVNSLFAICPSVDVCRNLAGKFTSFDHMYTTESSMTENIRIPMRKAIGNTWRQRLPFGVIVLCDAANRKIRV